MADFNGEQQIRKVLSTLTLSHLQMFLCQINKLQYVKRACVQSGDYDQTALQSSLFSVLIVHCEIIG